MKYRQVINYFKNLSEIHPNIKFFAFGDYDRILGAERDNISYPCMWLEVPNLSFKGENEVRSKVWNVAFVILLNAQLDDTETIEENIDTSEQICYDIISKILYDHSQGTFLNVAISDVNMDLVYSKNSDNDQGWRVELDISVKSNIACDQTIWNP